jgi:hypothetical protein
MKQPRPTESLLEERLLVCRPEVESCLSKGIPMKLEDASKTIGWFSSIGPLVRAPQFPSSPLSQPREEPEKADAQLALEPIASKPSER